MPSLAYIFNYCFSPVKSILHAYGTYRESADKVQEDAHKEKEKHWRADEQG